MYIPNIISVLRIFLVPIVIWLIITGNMQLAFTTFVIAGITDAIDGFLAKKFGWETELGAYLDPVADKLLLVSIYMALGAFAHLPIWLVIVVVSRDILIIGAILLAWMLDRPIRMHPLMISKMNTTGQIILAALVLGDLGFDLGLSGLKQLMVWLVGCLTILSTGAYLMTWLKHMASYEPAQVREDIPAPQKEKQGTN